MTEPMTPFDDLYPASPPSHGSWISIGEGRKMGMDIIKVIPDEGISLDIAQSSSRIIAISVLKLSRVFLYREERYKVKQKPTFLPSVLWNWMRATVTVAQRTLNEDEVKP